MQQDFYNQEDLKPKYYQARIDSSYQEVNHELNQNIRIEQSLSEMKYEVYSDSMTEAYIYLSLNQSQSLKHNNGIKDMYKYSYSKSLQQNSDSQDYKETANREVQKTNYKSRRCI